MYRIHNEAQFTYIFFTKTETQAQFIRVIICTSVTLTQFTYYDGKKIRTNHVQSGFSSLVLWRLEKEKDKPYKGSRSAIFHFWWGGWECRAEIEKTKVNE